MTATLGGAPATSGSVATTTAFEATVVIPAYNEAEGIGVVLSKLVAACGPTIEILVVDDGSTDATAQIARGLGVRVVEHATNQGKAAAMRTSLQFARGTNVIFIDADDTYPAERVPEMVELLRRFEMVVGSRQTGHTNIPTFNRIGNAIFRNSIRYFYGFKPYDPLTGFYGLRRDALLAMNLRSEDFRIESEIAIKSARLGLSMSDMPISYRSRIGQAKLRGLQDGYTIAETIVSMLPLYSPTLSLIVPGLVLLLGSTAGLLTVTGAILPLAIGGAVSGVSLVAAGAVSSIYGVTRLGIRGDFVARSLMRLLRRQAPVAKVAVPEQAANEASP